MKAFLGVLAGTVLIGAVHAAPYFGPGPQMPGMPMMQQQAASPALMLRGGIDRLQAFLGQDPRPSQQALAEFLNSEIAPFFDFEYMADSAGGRMFSRLDAAQQGEIVEQIRTSFLGKMAEKLGGYSNQQVRFLPPRMGNDGRTAQVSVAIMNPGTYPSRLDFRVYRNGDTWRVYDVAANGQSAIVHYRQLLTTQIRQQQMQRMQQMRQQRPMMPPRPTPPSMGYAPGRPTY
jgi:phospholipid transport system substrate-binding protein